MKFKLITLLAFFFFSICIHAQQFTQITIGSIATSNNSSGGCSWADYNHDGYPDLYISNTSTSNQLFKNNGDGTFQEITTGAIVNDGGVSNTAIWGDYDNDGNLDLFVSNNPANTSPPQLNFLYKNNGAPNYDFSKILNQATQTDPNYTWSSSWVDYDNDGDLDLHMPDNKHLRTDFFYENNGDGTFTSIMPSFVTPNIESTGVVSWIDYDHDGDQDLFMIKSGRTHPNNGEDNRMYHNLLMETGNLEFQRVTTAAMVNHFDLDFQASWGDYDNDGDMDVYLGNFDNRNYLYRNEGDSLFTKIITGPPATNNTATLGSIWGDFDNDGDLDLYVLNTNGQTSRYYQNDGTGNFTIVNSATIGTPVSNISFAQGCASADYNNDGYLDIYVVNAFNSGNGRNYFYKNNGGSNNYFQLTCIGTSSNRAAIGAKIWAKAIINGNPVWQLRHITGSPTGNRAQSDLRVHFGLGNAEIIDSLVIEWPLGLTEVYTNVNINQICEATEGSGADCMLTTRLTDHSIHKNAIKISPNPASINTVTIEYPVLSTKKAIIEVFNLQGALLEQHPAEQSGMYQLNISKYAAGQYFVKIKIGEHIFSKKLIIP